MKYRVTTQYGRENERPIAEFEDLNQAKAFIQSVLLPPAVLMKTDLICRIHKAFDLIEEFDAKKVDPASVQSSSQGSQGKSSSATARPTPFNYTPTPPGLPKKWLKDDNADDDEEKK